MLLVRIQYKIFFHVRDTGSLKIQYNHDGYRIARIYPLTREQYFDRKQGFTIALGKLGRQVLQVLKEGTRSVCGNETGNSH
jgi:hypothetical protein